MKWSCRLAEHHLETVEVRFGTDEAGDVIDHERIVAPGEAVTQGLGRGHVDAVVRAVGELAPLAGLEIHELLGDVAKRALGGHRAVAVVEQIDGNVELAQVGRLGAGQALEQDFDRRTAFEAGQLRLDVGQHADLRRHAGPASQRVEQPQQRVDVFDRVDGRIDADEGVAGSQRQAPVTQKGDSLRIVGRMIRLQSRRESARRTEQRSCPRRMADFAGDEDQLVHVAQLGEGGGHHAGEGRSDSRDLVAGCRQAGGPSVRPASAGAIDAKTSRSMS